jgi:MFS family permease
MAGTDAIRSALAGPNYRTYAIGSFCSHLGTWVQRVAVGWLAWELTGSGLWLGMIAFADLAPTVFLAPICGVVADRVNRLHGSRMTQSLAALLAIILWGMAIGGWLTIEWLFALVLLQGVIMAFNQPFRFAIVPSLVERKDLGSAIAINSISFNFARVAGPAIAGFLILHSGVAMAFLVNSVSYLIFIASLFLISPEMPPRGAAKPLRDVPGEILEGIQYCIRTPGVGPMFVMLGVYAVWGRAYSELLPKFADAVFQYGVGGFSMLTSATGAGSVAASIVLASRGSVSGLTNFVAWNILLLSLALAGLTATTSIWVGLGCVFLAGFSMLCVGVGEQTLLQNTLSSDVRGRVMSLYGMISRGGPALGALAIGWASDHIGLRWPVFIAALICLGLWLWFLPRRRAMAEALEGDGDRKPVT